MKDVTIIIKTVERPECLELLIRSIRHYYGDIRVLVANDGKTPVEGNFELFIMPYDSGLSAGRNLLLSQVNTKYFVLMDDDFIVTENTNLDLMRCMMGKFDLVGGKVEGHGDYHGQLRLMGDVLLFEKGEPYDIVLNFFMANTKKVREIGWDNELKLAEHTDFFLRAKNRLTIGYNEFCEVINSGGGDSNYKELRKRGTYYSCKFMEKHGIKKLIDFNGKEWDYSNCSTICE